MRSNPLATNAHYAELRSLGRSASNRRKAGQFIVEGPVLVEELMASPIEVSYLVGSDELLEVHADSGVDLFNAHLGKFRDAMSTQTPQPLAAVAKIPEPVPLGTGGALALVEMSDPGNAGTMIRTAEAAGMGVVAFVGDCVDTWNPKVVRASAGAVFRQPIARVSIDELFEATSSPILATVIDSGDHYLEANLIDAVLCMGNEARGLPDEFIQRCSGSITIPLAGPTESLNVAAAAAVVVFAALEQRRAITLAAD